MKADTLLKINKDNTAFTIYVKPLGIWVKKDFNHPMVAKKLMEYCEGWETWDEVSDPEELQKCEDMHGKMKRKELPPLQ